MQRRFGLLDGSRSCIAPPVRAAAGATVGPIQRPVEHRKRKQLQQQAQDGSRPRRAGGAGGGSSSGEDAAAGAWRLYNVAVSAPEDPGKDEFATHAALVKAVGRKLGCRKELPIEAVTVVRKSFDARARNGVKSWVYVVDVAAAAVAAAGARRLGPERQGQLERVPAALLLTEHQQAQQQQQQQPSQQQHAVRLVLPSAGDGHTATSSSSAGGSSSGSRAARGTHDRVVVVGGGPAGLFATLALAEAGLRVVLLERGQAVEERGRDLGALFVRGQLNAESNLCYGEGGAGTWSDGKLTTRIGRNSDPVRAVLQALHAFGAPDSVLVSGKPHLGTDRLIGILRAFRAHLLALGADVRFGTRVAGLISGPGRRAAGVRLADGSELCASRVVLAVGHSARDLYGQLAAAGVALEAKPFAMGFRIEHPQALIDAIQYGEHDAAAEVQRGKGRYPVADYSLAAQIPEAAADQAAAARQGATSARSTGIYSFCMCPGGQIVPTATTPGELCINGMSFSRRQSQWANSALVATVGPADWEHLGARHGALAGVELQREFERKAAAAGGGAVSGGLVAPVQRAVDFMAGQESAGALPSSSYRLGVRAAPLHDFYPPHMTAAFRAALLRFDRAMPGFLSDQALLHAAETRTSSPLRILRGSEDLQSPTMPGLYPCGEGAGYAGGIVSAAVDGLRVGSAIAAELTGRSSSLAANAGAYKVGTSY